MYDVKDLLAKDLLSCFPYINLDLLALSLISIINYIYSLGKKFHCTYFKTTEDEVTLSYAKPFNEKMRK